MIKAARRLLAPTLATVTAAAVLAWLWRCWCLFPWLLWNEVRLEPSFLLAHGLPVYPAPGAGAVTTWIYGPTTVLLLLPAALASSAGAALLTAGAINLALVAGTVLAVCGLTPASLGRQLAGPDRLAAAAICLLIWPASSLQYIQADNAAVALGLLANLLLVRRGGGSSAAGWLAALATVGAILGKQTTLGLAAAQFAWIAWSHGRAAMWRHAGRLVILGLLAAAAVVLGFGATGVWFNLYELPGRIPWTDAAIVRLRDLAPVLAVHLLIPAAVLWFARRRVWVRGSATALGACSWIASIPLGMASLMKSGGTINSLQGLLYLLPVLALAWLERPAGGWSARRAMACALGATALAVTRLGLSPAPVWRPVTAHLTQIDTIIAQLPGEVWLPWHPLVTYYREHRFDHVEDGLYVRTLARRPLSPAELRSHLPPAWSAVAFLRTGSDWGIARGLGPVNKLESDLGYWKLYSWNPHR